MEQSQKVFNLIILDESGSMQSCKTQTISGFNEVIQTIKETKALHPEQEQSITFVTFNGIGIRTLLFDENTDKVNEINEQSYKPNSSTPLYDAIGFSVTRLRSVVESQSDAHVLVTILTDGEENSSHEYSGKAISKLIDELKQKNWTFTYIGTEHDVENAAINISINNTLSFSKSPQAMKKMFDLEKSSRMEFYQKIRSKEKVGDNYFIDEKDNQDAKPS